MISIWICLICKWSLDVRKRAQRQTITNLSFEMKQDIKTMLYRKIHQRGQQLQRNRALWFQTIFQSCLRTKKPTDRGTVYRVLWNCKDKSFKPFQRSGKDFFKKIKFQQNQKILKPSIIGFVWALVKWKPYEGDFAWIVNAVKVPLCLPVTNSQCHDLSFSICQE